MRSETGQMEGFKPPREDINSPDLYIPGTKIQHRNWGVLTLRKFVKISFK